ncbi:hypothetical protein [Streptomyces sp. NPDC001205]
MTKISSDKLYTFEESDRTYAPPYTRAQLVTPSTVRVGDYVFLAGDFRRVDDMRSRGGLGRVLILRGYGPWPMPADCEVHRRFEPKRAWGLR